VQWYLLVKVRASRYEARRHANYKYIIFSFHIIP
jgi:hypothetical protein